MIAILDLMVVLLKCGHILKSNNESLERFALAERDGQGVHNGGLTVHIMLADWGR